MATIFPLADVVRQIGRDRVQVVCLLPPSQTPHGYEPTPVQAEKIANARLLVMMGLGVDEWARRSIEASGSESLRLIELGPELLKQAPPAQSNRAERHEAPKPPPANDHRNDQEKHLGEEDARSHQLGSRSTHRHRHGSSDPHMWLDPVLMQRFVIIIAAALADVDPAGDRLYRKWAEGYNAELAQLDTEYRQALSRAKRKHFVSFHPALGHLADRYGLEQATVFGADAHDFGPKQLENVVRFIRKHEISVVFAEPQLPAEKLKAIAEQTGATVAQIDPLGNPAVPGHDSYLALMRTNLAALVEALKKD